MGMKEVTVSKFNSKNFLSVSKFNSKNFSTLLFFSQNLLYLDGNINSYISCLQKQQQLKVEGKEKKLDRILTSVFEQTEGNTEEFLLTVLNFMKRKTDFGLLDNKKAKEIMSKVFERSVELELSKENETA